VFKKIVSLFNCQNTADSAVKCKTAEQNCVATRDGTRIYGFLTKKDLSELQKDRKATHLAYPLYFGAQHFLQNKITKKMC